MNKHTVFLLGKVTYFANTEEEAIKFAEKDIKDIHPKLNLEISGIQLNKP